MVGAMVHALSWRLNHHLRYLRLQSSTISASLTKLCSSQKFTMTMMIADRILQTGCSDKHIELFSISDAN